MFELHNDPFFQYAVTAIHFNAVMELVNSGCTKLYCSAFSFKGYSVLTQIRRMLNRSFCIWQSLTHTNILKWSYLILFGVNKWFFIVKLSKLVSSLKRPIWELCLTGSFLCFTYYVSQYLYLCLQELKASSTWLNFTLSSSLTRGCKVTFVGCS